MQACHSQIQQSVLRHPSGSHAIGRPHSGSHPRGSSDLPLVTPIPLSYCVHLAVTPGALISLPQLQVLNMKYSLNPHMSPKVCAKATVTKCLKEAAHKICNMGSYVCNSYMLNLLTGGMLSDQQVGRGFEAISEALRCPLRLLVAWQGSHGLVLKSPSAHHA